MSIPSPQAGPVFAQKRFLRYRVNGFRSKLRLDRFLLTVSVVFAADHVAHAVVAVKFAVFAFPGKREHVTDAVGRQAAVNAESHFAVGDERLDVERVGMRGELLFGGQGYGEDFVKSLVGELLGKFFRVHGVTPVVIFTRQPRQPCARILRRGLQARSFFRRGLHGGRKMRQQYAEKAGPPSPLRDLQHGGLPKGFLRQRVIHRIPIRPNGRITDRLGCGQR